jgi:helicase
MSDFPLFDRAEKLGVLKAEKGWLISAPTATGKSYIGIEVLKRNLPSKPAMEVYLYLVPFKALAEEMHSKLKQELPPETRINIKTGDYDRPFEPRETDVLVATYESIDGMIQAGIDFFPSIIIADEFSIISDGNRGARIESLISYLAKFKGGARLYALSAVLCDPERIAKWLDANVLQGDEGDRRIKLETKCILFPEGRKSDTLRKLVKNGLSQGNFLIFCERKKDAEKLCHELEDLVATSMKPQETQDVKELVAQLKYDFPYLVDFPELLLNGVAFHHADLEVDLRNRIAEAFRQRKIKVVAATTTLSAGVNLPARFVIVRDVTRYESGRKLLPVSEMVNMLGRSGRPGYDKLGTGYFLVQKEKTSEPAHKEFITKVKKCKVEELDSQIPKSMTNILHFILATAARFKGITRDDLILVYNTTLWGFENPLELPFLSGGNLTSRIEKILKHPEENVRIDEKSVQVVGGVLHARGGTGSYEIRLSEEKSTCECPAYQYRYRKPCKHIRQLQYDAILGSIGKKNQEARAIAIASFKSTGLKEDPMYMLSAGVDLLLNWRFLAENERRLVITRDGRQALVNYLLEMDHVQLLRDRITKGERAKDEQDVIRWAIDDYRIPKRTMYEIQEEETEKSDLPEELAEAVWKHIENGSYKQILPQKYIQRFLDAKDRLDQIFNAYLAFCSNEHKSLAWLIRTARRRVHYGCVTELLPLLVLDIEAIDEVARAQTLFKNGVKNVNDLARTDPNSLSELLKIPQDEAKKTVQTAGNIVKLVSEFTGEKAQLVTLAARTGVKIEDLLDYLLPKEMTDKLRA